MGKGVLQLQMVRQAFAKYIQPSKLHHKPELVNYDPIWMLFGGLNKDSNVSIFTTFRQDNLYIKSNKAVSITVYAQIEGHAAIEAHTPFEEWKYATIDSGVILVHVKC